MFSEQGQQLALFVIGECHRGLPGSAAARENSRTIGGGGGQPLGNYATDETLSVSTVTLVETMR